MELAAEKNGIKLPEGDELEEEIRRWSLINSSHGLDGTVRETEVTRLREELAQCRRQRDELKSIYDRLSLHHTSLVDRIARIESLKSSVEANFQEAVEQMQIDNEKVSLEFFLMAFFAALNI